ncbi:hypothetical protein Tfer_1380 [Thermincola ferriacetica]|uniref:ABC transporter permease n=1 Tax=Thermincola ferriacetica TaxID=281456 RepID=A0A0L6W352_9FIRM|nr:ABC transporter permease [Thermincola ferriacetica]KNZ69997.1 hypothetical protein Tfer_1380 [Thermincola ferriacetica]
MNLLEAVKIALEGLWTNKLRSSLTMLGIVIGIAAVIAVVAIGRGGQALLMSEISKVGSNLFAIYIDFSDDDPATPRDFSLDDIDLIKKLVPGIKGMSTMQSGAAQVKGTKGKKMASVQGVTGDFKFMRNIELVAGTFFSNHDAKSNRAVIVIEEKLADEIFGRENPIGKKVLVKSKPFTVIGVSKSAESVLAGLGGLKTAFIPASTWQNLFNEKALMGFEAQAASRDRLEESMQQAVKILERRHNNKDRYRTMTMEQEMQMINKVTGIMTLIVGAIAGISLFVGGIGVMNIMLVSVTERTREIGIRKALGARRKDIMVQFLIEAVVICLIGGVFGAAIGVGGAYMIARFAKWPPLVSWGTIAIAFIFSSAVGIFFGLYPASKAARLDPIEALRHE